MIRRVSLAATCALIVVLGGCDLFGGSESPQTLAGSWRGRLTTADSSYTVTLNLEQPQGAGTQQSPVSGNGELATDATTWDFTVSGTFARPTLDLSLRFQSARPGRLRGEVNEDLSKIEAQLFGGAGSFNGDTVTFERQ